jgi:type I restriction-modification system DNA methylase subunit
MLEAVIGLPDQLFYNTGISTYIWIVTNRKRKERRGRVRLINGGDFAWRMKKSLGDKRKQIGDGTEGAPNHIEVLTKLYGDFQTNVPESMALAFNDGITVEGRYGDQVMYTLEDERVMYVPPIVQEQIKIFSASRRYVPLSLSQP